MRTHDKHSQNVLPTPQKVSFSHRILGSIGRGILHVLKTIFLALTLLPVLLLPLITAVPPLYFLLLVLLDGALLYWLLVRSPGTALRIGLSAGFISISVLAVVLSQWTATTPVIAGENGQPLPGSIAQLESVELGGQKQWITLRGHSENLPVLLFLAGGPGGSQLAATRKRLAALEEHFVVVNWDQPGAGKSYRAADFETLTPQQYVDDALELTDHLRQRFHQEKIYLAGESWGSILGVWMVQAQPKYYHAFVGLAQMVDFLETDLYDYHLALDITREQGDSGTLRNLQKQGAPPYYGKGVSMKVARYMMVLSGHMQHNPQITGPGYDTFGDIFAPEYGLYDKINYFRGLLQVMDVLWPQLWDTDLKEQAPRLEVPIYFLEGRHDVNAPPHLAEEYLDILKAPHKELIWFEHSGHSPWVDESAKVVDVLVNTVQADTVPIH